MHLEFRHLRTIRAIHEAGGLAEGFQGFRAPCLHDPGFGAPRILPSGLHQFQNVGGQVESGVRSSV